jgi:hypothetical protein
MAMPYHYQDFSIATAGSTCSAFYAAGWNRLGLEFPTFATRLVATTCNVYLDACATEDGTFRTVYQSGIYSAASGIAPWEIPSTIGNISVEYNGILYPWMRLRFSQTATASGNVARIHYYREHV